LADSRAARIAAVVAQRYANSPSYRAVLAAEAERALQQARAAAEIAARNAQAIQQAHEQFLDTLSETELEQPAEYSAPDPDLSRDFSTATEKAVDTVAKPIEIEQSSSQHLELWPEVKQQVTSASVERPKLRPISSGGSNHSSVRTHAASPSSAHAPTELWAAKTPTRVGLTVHLYETTVGASRLNAGPIATNRPAPGAIESSHEAPALETLDQEIAFRQSPIFEEPAGPPTPIPANLIEFPRQLVAPRKARPRYAEGPLRDEEVPPPGDAQLRIFEVETAQISTTPETTETPSPQWTSIWLDALHPIGSMSATDQALPSSHEKLVPTHDSHPFPRPHCASISRRVRAAAIDGAFILMGFLVFAATSLVASGSTAHTSLTQLLLSAATGPAATRPPLGAMAAALVIFYLLYQMLFFSLSEATPGMRSARIAFCTFADENPTRRAVRRRALAVLVSILPFGLGFLWATLDDDRLAWHDRLTRIYQRSY
jgi:uncharacterized RDD family membrane protein YckC